MKRSRSLAAFTRTKRRLIVTVATAAVLLISSCAAVAMVQFYQADYQALEQRGATRKTLDSFRALSTADGLFDMPELGTRNTEESRINATYMVSQMVGENHDKVSTQRTLDSLYAYAKDERNPLAMRLKAYVALKNFKDTRWESSDGIVKQVEQSFPKNVASDGLAEYLSLAEPVAVLDSDFTPTTMLVPFNPLTNEQTERLATSAMITRYLFGNGSQIPEYFSDLSPDLCAWASGDSPYVQQTLLAADALTGTEQSSCISRPAIKKLFGCKNSTQMIAIDGSRTGVCSLTLTYYAYRSGAAPL